MRGMMPMGGMRPPEDADFPQGGRPEMPEGMEFPLNGERPEKPEGRGFSQDGKGPGFGGNADAEVTTAFEIVEGENTFASVKPAE